MTRYRSDKLPFKPRARMLLLLGDQLIRDSGIAVFELVKNAYDADASKATVIMKNVTDPRRGEIVVEDNGSGMDWKTVTEVWLEPGTDYRSRQREAGERTPKFHRLPLGEKGVGRFAAHKLGRQITMITRQEKKPEVVVNIDWGYFEGKRYLSDAKVSVEERSPRVFPGRKHGTRIEIRGLRDTWTRGMVRNLHRAINSICSPFEGPEDFKTELILEPDYGWLKGLFKVPDVLEFALFRATCRLEGTKLSYDYEFTPLPGMDRVFQRTESVKEIDIIGYYEDENGKRKKYKVDLDAEPDFAIPKESGEQVRNRKMHIGPIDIHLYIFDREPAVLALGVSDKKGLKEFLDSNGGIRVYRDGVRVYNYGEPENDWLDLGGRRVNVPARRISNNLVIGAVSLSLKKSSDLIEKTNREGFVDNIAYKIFRDAVLFAVQQIELERNKDKIRIRTAYSRKRQREPVLEELSILRTKLEKYHLEQELGPYIDRIESQFREVRDQLLTAAGAGLSLAVVIHEVEKGIDELAKAVSRDVSIQRVKELAKHLSELVEGLTYLTRRSGMRKEKASVLIKHALFNTEYRLRYHKIKVLNGLEDDTPDFQVKCTRRLIIATLMNLIDNAIWWLDNKGSTDKRIYIGTTLDLQGGPAIVVADNGPGFIDPPEYLVQPFMSRKPDGMGLGLHLASEVMKAHGGRLEFPEDGDVELPGGMSGAVVALVFGGQQ